MATDTLNPDWRYQVDEKALAFIADKGSVSRQSFGTRRIVSPDEGFVPFGDYKVTVNCSEAQCFFVLEYRVEGGKFQPKTLRKAHYYAPAEMIWQD